jgi:hypothetical protein
MRPSITALRSAPSIKIITGRFWECRDTAVSLKAIHRQEQAEVLSSLRPILAAKGSKSVAAAFSLPLGFQKEFGAFKGESTVYLFANHTEWPSCIDVEEVEVVVQELLE